MRGAIGLGKESESRLALLIDLEIFPTLNCVAIGAVKLRRGRVG